jgi:PEP-CTERM motif-containing protein
MIARLIAMRKMHRKLFGIFLSIALGFTLVLTAYSHVEAQLKDTNANGNWRDRPVAGDQRRHVKVHIAAPPAGHEDYTQAVRNAITAWKTAQNFSGGIVLDEVAAAADADIKIEWTADPKASWGTTTRRAGGTGAMTIMLSYAYRDGGAIKELNATQIETGARHELGHGEGLNDNGTHDSGAMRVAPGTNAAAQADYKNTHPYTINADEIAAKKQLYDVGFFDFPSTFGVGLAAVTGGFLYTYDVSVAATATSALDRLGVFTLADVVEPRNVPTGWQVVFDPPELGLGKNEAAPGIILATSLLPADALEPGGSLEFQFFSPSLPALGSAYLLSSAETAIHELNDVIVPGQLAVPEPSTCLMFGTGLIGIVAYTWRRRKLRPVHLGSAVGSHELLLDTGHTKKRTPTAPRDCDARRRGPRSPATRSRLASPVGQSTTPGNRS